MLDLRHLQFGTGATSGSPGVVLKAVQDGRFYKLPNFNENTGFYGYSSMNDVIAARYLTSIGIQTLLYCGAEAVVQIRGREFTTFVNWSLDYRMGRPDIAFEDYVRTSGAIDPEAVFRTLDSAYLDTMLAADFLVGNRDRHGANIRWLGDGFSPLFDFNLSLFMPDGGSRLHDIMANNYIGSHSLLDNLELVREFPAVQAPNWSAVFDGVPYPYVQELKDWLDWRRSMYEDIRRCHS